MDRPGLVLSIAVTFEKRNEAEQQRLFCLTNHVCVSREGVDADTVSRL